MSFRNDTYTGGEHYWIRFYNGTHEVRRETADCFDDNETVFTGDYEDCLCYLQKLQAENVDYDFNL